MLPSTFARRVAAAFAAGALLFASLAPALSHALAARGAQPLAAMVCTAAGARAVALPADSGAPQPPAAHPLDHCPFCASHGATLAPPPAALALLAVPGVDPLPALERHAARPLFARTAAQPRAPPFAS